MTFKEKLAKDYPIYVIERLKEGCYGCPSSYGYEPTQPKYFCQNTSCGICWNRIISGTEGEEKVFTKDDLKDGMIVETREGKRYLAFKKNAIGDTTWLQLESYEKDFTCYNHRLDIMKVFESNNYGSFESILKYPGKLIWERKGVKEISTSEAEKLLLEKFPGYNSVKIIDKKG